MISSIVSPVWVSLLVQVQSTQMLFSEMDLFALEEEERSKNREGFWLSVVGVSALKDVFT